MEQTSTFVLANMKVTKQSVVSVVIVTSGSSWEKRIALAMLTLLMGRQFIHGY
jgi:hypothetical protein